MSGNQTDGSKDNKEIKPNTKETGIAHLFAATKYSIAGLRVLLKEAAFRHEIFLSIVLFISLLIARAANTQLIILVVLILILFSVEALNTAIENIVDKISPERSDFAKETKDLGSFAVSCILLGIIAYWIYALLTAVHLIN